MYVHPDPLEFLYSYPDIKNREVVGLIASSLAYGKVKQILKSVSSVLDIMKPSPYRFLMNSNYTSLYDAFEGFTIDLPAELSYRRCSGVGRTSLPNLVPSTRVLLITCRPMTRL